MKMVLPKQHGAWAMLIVPYWLCVIAVGFHWIHIPFFIGWFFVYLVTYPLLALVKTKKRKDLIKWIYIYLMPAIVFLAVPFIYEPKIVMFSLALLPLFTFNIYFASTNNERDILNDICAIVVFCISGLMAGYLAEGAITKEIFYIAMLNFLYFLGTVFYVKTMIREKNNVMYKWTSWIYHGMLVLLFLLDNQIFISLAFLLGFIRAVVVYGKKVTILNIGIIEIINAVWFSIFIILYILI